MTATTILPMIYVVTSLINLNKGTRETVSGANPPPRITVEVIFCFGEWFYQVNGLAQVCVVE
jgi:hypothetical protein